MRFNQLVSVLPLWTFWLFSTTSLSKEAAVSSPMAVMELERIDGRLPLPLSPMMANHQKRNMREHLQAVQGIIAGVSSNDFEMVAKAARTMGYSEEMRKMCTNMGAGAPGFTERAIAFHKLADTIAEAAKFKDQPGVLKALNATLQACTGCHAQYRQQLVDTNGNTKVPIHHHKAP